MSPQLKLTPTRAAFARPGPDATPFPDVNAPMQPSDSLAPFGRRSGLPSPTAYLGAQALFFAATPVPTPTCATSETLLPRLPVRRLSLPKEKRGYPRCLGHPLRACRGPRPRRVQPPLARSRCGHRRLQVWKYLGHPEVRFISWLLYPRPTRSRAYASPNPLPSPAQGSLPARAGSPLARRFRTRWMTKQGFMKSSQTPFLLDQPCLVALPPEPTEEDAAVRWCGDGAVVLV